MAVTLHRYILKEQFIPFAVAAFGVSFVLVSARLLQLARYLFTTSISFVDLLQLMGLAVPKLLMYTLPMAVLIGVILGFSRLSGDNELTAVYSAGVSFYQLFPPVLTMVLAVTVFSYYNTLYLAPKSNTAFEVKLRALGKASLPALLKEGTFIDIIPNLVFFFRSVDTSNLSIQGVLVEDRRSPEIRVTIVASEAKVSYQKNKDQIVFKIRNGIITRTPDNFRDAQAVSFKSYDLTLSLDELTGGGMDAVRGKSSLSLSELLERAEQCSEATDRASHLLAFHQRLSLPFSCLILGLLGAPLGAISRQKNRMTGISMGLGVFLTYYIMLSAGKGLGENLLIPVFWAVWLPNLLCACLATYLWIQKQHISQGVDIQRLCFHRLNTVSRFIAKWARHPHTQRTNRP